MIDISQVWHWLVMVVVVVVVVGLDRQGPGGF